MPKPCGRRKSFSCFIFSMPGLALFDIMIEDSKCHSKVTCPPTTDILAYTWEKEIISNENNGSYQNILDPIQTSKVQGYETGCGAASLWVVTEDFGRDF